MTDRSRSALDLGRAIARGALDPVDLTEDCLAAAHASESVFISLDAARARREAEAASARAKVGQRSSALDGVPLAWKDLFDVAGSATTAGGTVHGRGPATRDAAAVANTVAAGMVTLGKTNLTELAYSGLGLNPHYGTPHATPGDGPARVPGGSSSGSAVAVARGIVPAATGTDTAGSLRVPAAFNGLVSYRPSRNRHDARGMRPLATTLDTPGAMATTLADCVAVDDVMRGRPISVRRAAPAAETVIVVDTDVLDGPEIDAAVRTNLLSAAERLREAGFIVARRPVASVSDTRATIRELGWLGAIEAYTEHRNLLASDAAEALDARVRARLWAARETAPDTVVRLYRRRRRLIAAFAAEMGHALLLTPTVAHPAPELAPLAADADRFATVNRQTLGLTMVASLLDCPAIALPSGRDARDQFTSLQLSAPRGADEHLLCAAAAIAAELAPV